MKAERVCTSPCMIWKSSLHWQDAHSFAQQAYFYFFVHDQDDIS
jgi:hypothetical protein